MAQASQTYEKNVQFELSTVSQISSVDDRFGRAGYQLTGWLLSSGETISYKEPLSVTFTDEVTNLSGIWKALPFTLTFTETQTEGNITVTGGSVSYKSGDKIDCDTPLTVSVNANEGYKLQNIFVNGTSIIDTMSFKVPPCDFTITTTWNDVGGTVFFYPGY